MMKNVKLSLLGLAIGLIGLTTAQSAPVTNESVAPAAAPATIASPSSLHAVALTALDANSIATNADGVIRINAGASANVRDSAGHLWLADQGFVGGDVIERPEVQVTNVSNAVIYQSEHYGMDSFSWKLPNGKYRVKLSFAETYDGITGPGDRVFSFNVQGQDFKDFDVWKLAGGTQLPYVVTTDVTVGDGQLLIKFTPNVENPQVNGIEIIPLAPLP